MLYDLTSLLHTLPMKYLLIITITLLSCSACKDKKPEPELPPITQTGENTFGCYIDGVPYAIFDGTPGGFDGTWTKFYDHDAYGALNFSIQRETPRWWLYLAIKNPDYKTGTFISNGDHLFISSFFDYKEGGSLPSPTNLYETTDEHYLTVVITKAIKDKQYAGTFSGEMISEAGKVVHITDGRFDIKK